MDWIKVATTDQLDNDDVMPLTVGEAQVALYRSDDEFYATDNVCTHAYALLSDGFLEDGCIECPLHQGRFDIKSGKALSAPVTTDVRSWPVRVDGDDVYIADAPQSGDN